MILHSFPVAFFLLSETILKDKSTIRPNNNEKRSIFVNVDLLIRCPVFAASVLWLQINFPLNENSSSGCDRFLHSIASTPCYWAKMYAIRLNNNKPRSKFVNVTLSIRCPFFAASVLWLTSFLLNENPSSSPDRSSHSIASTPCLLLSHRAKMHAFLECAKHMRIRLLGQNRYLVREVGKIFNPSLMNKLMRFEWVSEWLSKCHSTASESPCNNYVMYKLKIELIPFFPIPTSYSYSLSPRQKLNLGRSEKHVTLVYITYRLIWSSLIYTSP